MPAIRTASGRMSVRAAERSEDARFADPEGEAGGRHGDQQGGAELEKDPRRLDHLGHVSADADGGDEKCG